VRGSRPRMNLRSNAHVEEAHRRDAHVGIRQRLIFPQIGSRATHGYPRDGDIAPHDTDNVSVWERSLTFRG
jgi:hypothetical protein